MGQVNETKCKHRIKKDTGFGEIKDWCDKKGIWLFCPTVSCGIDWDKYVEIRCGCCKDREE